MYELTWLDEKRWRAAGGADAIPLAPSDRAVRRVADLLWEEHCVECAIPECYSTCRLYVARRDHKCARFVYGIYPNHVTSGLFGYGADVQFRRWGKIEAMWTKPPRLMPVSALRRHALWDHRVSRLTNFVDGVLQRANPRRRMSGLHTWLRRRWLEWGPRRSWSTDNQPDALYVKFFNPRDDGDDLVVEAYQDQLTFRVGIAFGHGWTEHVIPLATMRLDLAKPVRLLIRPAGDRETRLVFTWLDFVEFAGRPAQSESAAQPTARVPSATVKCVAWDLDGTLWDGVIGDDGPQAVQPRAHVLHLIQELDARGILQTIASKNEHHIAWRKIEELGLGEYFLHPAINWGPKSQSIRTIATELNIGLDSFAFIDDSASERAEVGSALPQVRVYDAQEVLDLLARPEFTVPVTTAARTRRLSYLTEARRRQTAAQWGSDYAGFLRSCGFRMRIGRPRADQHSRCLELIHRSNQLNLSTRRYSDEEFAQVVCDDRIECFALECADKFGDYGVVGFVSIDVSNSVPVLVDFVLSCRVAQKRVEEAFVHWYAVRARRRGARRLRVVFVPTDRNKPLRDVLAQLPFRVVSDQGTRQILEMAVDEPLEAPDSVAVEVSQEEPSLPIEA